MYCTKCGKEIKNGIAYCTYCGNPTGVAATVQSDTAAVGKNHTAEKISQKQSASGKAPAGNKFPVGLFLGCLALCLVLAVGGLVGYYYVVNGRLETVLGTEPDTEGTDRSLEDDTSKEPEDTRTITGYEVETIRNDYSIAVGDSYWHQILAFFEKPVFQGNNSEIVAAINAKIDAMAMPYKQQQEIMSAEGWATTTRRFGIAPALIKNNNVGFNYPDILKGIYFDDKYLSICWESPSYLADGISGEPYIYYESITFDLTTGKQISLYDLMDTDPREIVENGLAEYGGGFDYDGEAAGEISYSLWEAYNLYDVAFFVDESKLYVLFNSGALIGGRQSVTLSFDRDDYHYIPDDYFDDTDDISQMLEEYIISIDLREDNVSSEPEDSRVITGYEVETISNDYSVTRSDARYTFHDYFEKPVFQGNTTDIISAINAKLNEMAQPYVDRQEEMMMDEWLRDSEYEWDKTLGIDPNADCVYYLGPLKLKHIYYDDNYLSLYWYGGYSEGDDYNMRSMNIDLSTGKELTIYDFMGENPRVIIEKGLMAKGVFNDEEYLRDYWEDCDLNDVKFYFDESAIYVSIPLGFSLTELYFPR